MPDETSATPIPDDQNPNQITQPLPEPPADLEALHEPTFPPTLLRGYDRRAVDAYVDRVSAILLDLRASRSPQEAIRRALDRVGEETSAILQRAHDAADQVTRDSRAKADDRVTGAQAEADRLTGEANRVRTDAASEAEAVRAEARQAADAVLAGAAEQARAVAEEAQAEAERLVVESQQRVSELDADTDRIWSERQRIIDVTRDLAGELERVAGDASERFPAESEGARSGADDGGAETDVDPQATVEHPAARPEAEGGPDEGLDAPDAPEDDSEQPTVIRSKDTRGPRRVSAADRFAGRRH